MIGDYSMITAETWKRGLQSGLKTSWILGKIVFPITLIMGVLKYTPVIDWIVLIFKPLMGWIGLPGEAAIPLVLGFVLNLYAGIGAILSMSLEVKEVFILAVMLSFAHNLIVETAVTSKMGVPAWLSLAIRIGMAFSSAFTIHLVWKGGQEKAQYGIFTPEQSEFQSWGQVFLDSFSNAFFGLIQLMVIIFPLMLVIQLLKEGNVLSWLAKMTRPFTKLLGLPENASLTLMAGTFFGLAFGAGVLIQAVEEEKFSKRDLLLLVIFLAACHAVVEDTLIFIPLGIPVIYLLLIRLFVAVVATIVVARILRKAMPTQEMSKGV